MIDFFQEIISKYSPPGFITLKLFGLDNYKKVIDLGCGNISVLKSFNNEYKFGVDIFEDFVNFSKKNDFHDEYMVADVTSPIVLDKVKEFDAVICFDVIEHLEESESKLFIENLEKLKPRFLAFRSTSKFVIQSDEFLYNPYQAHKSCIPTIFFKKRGYYVLGTDGPRFLMIEDGKVNQNLTFIQRFFINILKPIFYLFPDKSLNYIAIKKFN